MLAGKMMAGAASAGALPTFISSSVTVINNSTVVVTAPSGIQNGDLLVAIACNVNANADWTFPTGFNRLFQDNSVQPTIAIGFKIAASESGNYTFTQGGAADNSVSILVYRNATRVNTIGSIQYLGGASVAAPSITPTFTGVLLATFIQRNAGTFTITTPPSGMTNRVTSTPSSARPHTYIYDQNQTAAVTGDKTVTWSPNGACASFLIQVTNEPTVAPEFVASASTQRTTGGTTLTINKPTGTIENDLMVAVMADNNSGTTWTGDTGWTEVADEGAVVDVRIAYKVAGASEGASYVFTATQIKELSGCILTYRYAAYDTVGSFTSNTNPLVLPSISPSESQSILIAIGARNGTPVTIGTPISMTAQVTDNDVQSPSYKVCDQLVAKGPTGTRSMSTGSITNVAGIMLSIKPTRSL